MRRPLALALLAGLPTPPILRAQPCGVAQADWAALAQPWPRADLLVRHACRLPVQRTVGGVVPAPFADDTRWPADVEPSAPVRGSATADADGSDQAMLADDRAAPQEVPGDVARATVPEPSTFALAFAGAAGVLLGAWWRARRAGRARRS